MTRIEEPQDCKKIQEAMLECGWECTLAESQELWRARSGAYDAIWLQVPESTQSIWEEIEQYASTTPTWKNRQIP